MTVKAKKEAPEFAKIKLNEIVANSGQTRGMGVMSQLKALGYGVFEKEAVDKEPIWPMLVSDKPEQRKEAVTLIREHEPDILSAAESQDQYGQLQPIRVIKRDDGYDIVYGMTRALARAFNLASDAKSTEDTIDVMVMESVSEIDTLFMGFAENNDRRQESVIDKALFFEKLKKDHSIKPEDIGKRIGLTGQSVRDYLKMLHPKLEDKRMDIHSGALPIVKAKKLLAKRLENEGDEGDDDGKKDGGRSRFPSTKKIEAAYDAKKKPGFMDQKVWEMFVTDDVRKFCAYYLKKKFRPFSGEVLSEEPEPPAKEVKKKGKEEKKNGKVLKLTIPKSLAVKLLTALGKPESEGWTDKQLVDKLESLPNLVEEGMTLESEKLNALMNKLVKHYATGVKVTIK